jgi:hypothetical protein
LEWELGRAASALETREWPDTGLIIARVFDASTFAGSMLLLIGIFVPSMRRIVHRGDLLHPWLKPRK